MTSDIIFGDPGAELKLPPPRRRFRCVDIQGELIRSTDILIFSSTDSLVLSERLFVAGVSAEEADTSKIGRGHPARSTGYRGGHRFRDPGVHRRVPSERLLQLQDRFRGQRVRGKGRPPFRGQWSTVDSQATQLHQVSLFSSFSARSLSTFSDSSYFLLRAFVGIKWALLKEDVLGDASNLSCTAEMFPYLMQAIPALFGTVAEEMDHGLSFRFPSQKIIPLWR